MANTNEYGETIIETASDLREVLSDFIGCEEGVKRVESFEEVGVMTRDEGFIVRMSNGAEFYVTIQQTREPNEPETDGETDGDEDDGLVDCPACGGEGSHEACGSCLRCFGTGRIAPVAEPAPAEPATETATMDDPDFVPCIGCGRDARTCDGHCMA